jgi:hypothetical protein
MQKYIKASELQPGDEVKFSNGETDIIENRYNDPEGTWVNCMSGECGYMNGYFLVINL